MSNGYSFLICLMVVEIIAGCNQIYTTLKYKNYFKNYKEELMFDITITILPLITLIIFTFF